MQAVLELQDSKCCWCSSEMSTVRGCISAERSIYYNRTVSSPVITGLLTVLLKYVYQSFSAEHSQQLLPQPQPSDTCTNHIMPKINLPYSFTFCSFNPYLYFLNF